MTKYKLIMHLDKDIEILKSIENRYFERVYYKSYNMSDDLKQNLINAYEWLEKTENEEKKENE